MNPLDTNYNRAFHTAQSACTALRTRRLQLGLTVEEVHAATGIATKSIGTYERGQAFPSLLNYYRIVTFLQEYGQPT